MEFWSEIISMFAIEIDWSNVRKYFITLLITALTTFLVIKFIRISIHQFFKRTDWVDEKKEKTIESVIRNTSNYVLFIVIFVAAIKPFVANLRDFIMAGGIIAAIIGFGAQKIINDILSGVFIIFERTIHKGDFVHINGEQEGGFVEEMGFRIVKIRLINGKLVTIANGEIRKLVNGSVKMRRVFESVIVSFNENPSRIKAILEEVCETLNKLQPEYLKLDPLTNEAVERYRVYGLHSLDTSPFGYKFSISATVNDTDYLTASLQAKEIIAQAMYDHKVQLPTQRVLLGQEYTNL